MSLIKYVSREIIAVADSGKFEQRGYQIIPPFDRVSTPITDKSIPENFYSELSRKGVKVIIADAE